VLIGVIRSYIQKTKAILRPITAQLIFVFIVFAIMVITIYLYVSDIEHQSLREAAEESIANAQTNITANLSEPEAVLDIIAETARNMILNNYSFETVSKYITNITDYIIHNDGPVVDATSTYGFFDVYDGKFHSGIDWVPSDDYVPVERPWYTAAVEKNGEVGITEPYLDVSLGVMVITYARRIFDDEGRPLGIICLDILLDRVRKTAINTKIAAGGYGMLLDKQFKIIAHPNETYWGKDLRNIHNGIYLENELKQKTELSEHKWENFRDDPSVLFIRQIENGWYLGIVISEYEYYRSVRKIAFLLGIIGFAMVVALNIILVRIAAAKRKSDTESRQKTNFLTTMSHEIRTPLNAILGITEILIQRKALPQDVSEALIKINNSGYLLLGIINDILDLSKIEAGKLELMPVKYQVARMIHDTTQINLMWIGSKAIKFELEVDPFVPKELLGDELRVKQILSNLLSNAFKYTDSGKVVLSVSAKYEDKVKDTQVKLIFCVSDTGQGMTPDQISKLFNEFSRFNPETNREIEGTGLGMSITRKLVQMMEGRISVESEPGKGSTFTVDLMQKNIGAAPLGEDVVKKLQSFRFTTVAEMNTPLIREPMPYGHILVVDDVETNLYVARGLLSPYGLSIDTATSGFEVIDKIIAGNMYDIILMDHMMPKMDGIEAVRIIRDLGYTSPIVALTANAVAGQAQMFMLNGFDDFISKPIDVLKLNTVLNKLIRDKQPPELIVKAQKEAQKNSVGRELDSFVSPELANIFVNDAWKAVQILEAIHEKRDTLADEDIQLYIINTHSMKSALINIGEEEASEFAKKLEAAGRERNIAVISTETPVFLNILWAIIKKITPKEEDISAKEEDDIALLQEKLLIFRAACTIYDKKAAKEVIIELRKERWSQKPRLLLNKLAEHLLHSDFEEAASIARDFDFS
jgi:signal transduction histidine kinase/FixJ family two-component response regulator/histone H3/H4